MLKSIKSTEVSPHTCNSMRVPRMCVAEHDFMLQHPRKCREICTPRDDEEVSKTAAMAAKKALSKY